MALFAVGSVAEAQRNEDNCRMQVCRSDVYDI